MLTFEKEKFEENLDDIMDSINEILNKTGEGFETTEMEENEEGKKDNK